MKNLQDYTPDLIFKDIPPIDDRASSPGEPNLLCSIWALRNTSWAELLGALTTC
ncbi:hypothetical protein BOTBODRAFT_29950 [Botryobasidium botryosum FD-172 SS1]|uniref:Uncharacterized protein n=1 Tax=Botryobasidium botryosum (strain FD-172 SS1) TaxID=930990 RepID=A0A067MSW8_BOTB1|nr:hypothetical protein BOTBODRAFT_29950 [Botryobasidium botryosum FD-172 SS1]